MTVSPIRKAIVTKAAPPEAFEFFTAHMSEWFPAMCLRGKPGGKILIEPFVDGRWLERDAAGNETHWGKVLVWEPPETLVLCWQVDRHDAFDPMLHTEVVLNFYPHEAGGTEVTLEHRHIERFGKSAGSRVAKVGDGWSFVLGEFATRADRAASLA